MVPHEDLPPGWKHLFPCCWECCCWWPSTARSLWDLPSTEENCILQDLPNIVLLLRHRLHSMAGQCWVMSEAVLLPELRMTPKGHLSSGSPCWDGWDFALRALYFNFSLGPTLLPHPTPHPQPPRGDDSENTLIKLLPKVFISELTASATNQ